MKKTLVAVAVVVFVSCIGVKAFAEGACCGSLECEKDFSECLLDIIENEDSAFALMGCKLQRLSCLSRDASDQLMADRSDDAQEHAEHMAELQREAMENARRRKTLKSLREAMESKDIDKRHNINKRF